LSAWVNNNYNSNALALLYPQQKQQQLSGISTSKVGYSSINEIPTFLSSYSDGAMPASRFSTSSSSSSISYNTATIPHLVMVDSLIGNLGKEINRIVQNSNDSTATLIVETHVINTNGGTGQASDFSNCIDTSNGGSNSLQCGTGSEGSSASVIFNAGPYKVYQNPNNQVSGYSVSYSKECSGVIKAGETKICTITYHDTSTTS
jgi:hypothetical protein